MQIDNSYLRSTVHITTHDWGKQIMSEIHILPSVPFCNTSMINSHAYVVSMQKCLPQFFSFNFMYFREHNIMIQ